MTKREPMPCPFCGAGNISVGKTENGWSVKCAGCSTTISGYASRRAALNAWNSRPPAQDDDEAHVVASIRRLSQLHDAIKGIE